MPTFKITWEFAGEVYTDLVECDTQDEAEGQASDNLERLVSKRTAYSAELVESDDDN